MQAPQPFQRPPSSTADKPCRPAPAAAKRGAALQPLLQPHNLVPAGEEHQDGSHYLGASCRSSGCIRGLLKGALLRRVGRRGGARVGAGRQGARLTAAPPQPTISPTEEPALPARASASGPAHLAGACLPGCQRPARAASTQTQPPCQQCPNPATRQSTHLADVGQQALNQLQVHLVRIRGRLVVAQRQRRVGQLLCRQRLQGGRVGLGPAIAEEAGAGPHPAEPDAANEKPALRSRHCWLPHNRPCWLPHATGPAAAALDPPGRRTHPGPPAPPRGRTFRPDPAPSCPPRGWRWRGRPGRGPGEGEDEGKGEGEQGGWLVGRRTLLHSVLCHPAGCALLGFNKGADAHPIGQQGGHNVVTAVHRGRHERRRPLGCRVGGAAGGQGGSGRLASIEEHSSRLCRPPPSQHMVAHAHHPCTPLPQTSPPAPECCTLTPGAPAAMSSAPAAPVTSSSSSNASSAERAGKEEGRKERQDRTEEAQGGAAALRASSGRVCKHSAHSFTSRARGKGRAKQIPPSASSNGLPSTRTRPAGESRFDRLLYPRPLRRRQRRRRRRAIAAAAAAAAAHQTAHRLHRRFLVACGCQREQLGAVYG